MVHATLSADRRRGPGLKPASIFLLDLLLRALFPGWAERRKSKR